MYRFGNNYCGDDDGLLLGENDEGGAFGESNVVGGLVEFDLEFLHCGFRLRVVV